MQMELASFSCRGLDCVSMVVHGSILLTSVLMENTSSITLQTIEPVTSVY